MASCSLRSEPRRLDDTVFAIDLCEQEDVEVVVEALRDWRESKGSSLFAEWVRVDKRYVCETHSDMK
jgi:hypothetical protein